MAKVTAPNNKFSGQSYGVQFMNGVGETDDKWLLQLFAEKGYTVDEEQQEQVESIDLSELDAKGLKEVATERGIEYQKNATKEQMLELLGE